MNAVIILSVLGLFVLLVILFMKSVRGKMIEKFDDTGLITKSGKLFPWTTLLRIEYFFALDRTNKNKKIHSLHFYFKEGKASVGYLMRDINRLIQKANQLQVPKTEKTVGYYVK